LKKLLFTIGLLLCAGSAFGDVIAFTGTPDQKGHVFMAYITSLAHTSNTGNNITTRLGWFSNKDTTITMIGVDPDTLITLGIDSSEIDSVKIVFRAYQNVYLNLSGSNPDSLYVAWYKVVASDSNTTEGTVTFDNATTSQPWDTLGLGHGNDIAITKSEAFGDGNPYDTMMVYYASAAFLGSEDDFRNNKNVLVTKFHGPFDASPTVWYIPLQEFKEGLANSQFVKWAVKPFRIHDADGDNKCGLDMYSDDGAATQQIDMYIYYTPAATNSNTRRRRILSQ